MQDTIQNHIQIFGARENNLKNINLEIPKNKLVVFTGLSGSGKSTLAFDTLYARDKGDIWRVYLATQGSFWIKSANLMSIKSRG